MIFRAVVEDNNDPLKMSRVRVRIFGMHTAANEHSSEQFNNIKSSDLPWAEVFGGTDEGLIAGIGKSNVLRQGTWVYVVLDSDNPNKPMVIGTVKGNTKFRNNYSSGEGFNDKDELYPFDARTEESDINRLARNERLSDPYYDTNRSVYNSQDTIHKQINDNVDVVSQVDAISGADVSQTEPNSLNDNSVYPNVNVVETSSGHVIEYDDTSGNERIRLYHTSGSYMEMRPDGTFVQKSVDTDSASHYIHMSDVQEHIDKGVKRYVQDNLEEIIGQSVKRHVKKNIEEHVAGGVKENVDLDFFSKIGGYFKLTATGNLEIVNDVKITGNLEVTSRGTFGGNLTSKSELADSFGNLSSLRDAYDQHHHIGNLGIPTSNPINTDPKIRSADFNWTNSPKGFL